MIAADTGQGSGTGLLSLWSRQGEVALLPSAQQTQLLVFSSFSPGFAYLPQDILWLAMVFANLPPAGWERLLLLDTSEVIW